jgi:spoIIIJ-associated protein
MDKIQTIKTETEELLKKMIDSAEVEVTEEEGIYHIIIKTEQDAPTVIGRHGETIRAIQKILEVILYKNFSEPVSILVNVNDYREKQKERLELLASDMAIKTQSTKTASYLRGLSSYERKMVHEYVTKNYPELTTYSVGDGRDRRLVIDLKNNESDKSSSDETTENKNEV